MYFRTLLLAFSLLSGIMPATAQCWWSNPAPLIPDQNNSKNIFMTWAGYAWEYQVDDSSTAIYFKNHGSSWPLISLFSDPGVEYGNPKMYPGYPYSFIFFEKTTGDNTDLYICFIDDYGNLLYEPQPLATSPFTETNLTLMDNIWPRRIGWNQNGTIKAGTLDLSNYPLVSVIDVTTIDSANCSDPVASSGENKLFWIKHTDSVDVVRFSTISMAGWTLPTDYDTAQGIQSLKRSADGYDLLHWTFRNDTTWFMKDVFVNEPPNGIIPDVQQALPFDFDVSYIGVGVKSGKEYVGDNFFQAFITDSNGHDEVFLNDYWDIDIYSNISNMTTVCRNPQFFAGESTEPYTFNFYLTWEALVGDKWQVYRIKTPITFGSIEESSKSPVSGLELFPDPFSDHINLKFDLQQTTMISVDLIDNNGHLLANLLTENIQQGSISKIISIPEELNYSGHCFIAVGPEDNQSFIKAIRIW